ncbi:MAG TPA: amidohydrolase family protein [Polyangiaceae bacterium]|nr:amidohydrolase family protein [Polyangiaceae bacterium]
MGLAVHFHVAFGPGAYFRMSESGPLALEPVFTDPKLQATKFVIVHGGWPETNEAMVLTAKPNVWADFSWQALIRYPHALATTLRAWIEFKPGKLLFGTDAFDGPPGYGWEEQTWLATETARRALAIALTGMVRDREVTRERAIELARMVMHDNAADLYGLGSPAH